MERVNRQYSTEVDQTRTLSDAGSLSSSNADFCKSCGHWTNRPVDNNGKPYCKPCNERSKDIEK